MTLNPVHAAHLLICTLVACNGAIMLRLWCLLP